LATAQRVAVNGNSKIKFVIKLMINKVMAKKDGNQHLRVEAESTTAQQAKSTLINEANH